MELGSDYNLICVYDKYITCGRYIVGRQQDWCFKVGKGSSGSQLSKGNKRAGLKVLGNSGNEGKQISSMQGRRPVEKLKERRGEMQDR